MAFALRAACFVSCAFAITVAACDGDQGDADPASDASVVTPTPTAIPMSPEPVDGSAPRPDASPPPPPPPKALPIPPDDPPPVSVPGIEPAAATPIGRTGFTVNARIQPHRQRMKWSVEYGKTVAYGSTTTPDALGPRLASHYYESWDLGAGGWAAGLGGEALSHRAAGGFSGGHVRYDAPGDADANHIDGIGYIELTSYLHNGTCMGGGIINPYLGGGDTDMRDARVALELRGTYWSPDLSEIHFWSQSDSNLATQNDADWRRANWAFTDFTLTDAALAGAWVHVEYKLLNDSNKWSYAGRQIAQGRPNYEYWPLDRSLRHLNCNFIHALVLNDPAAAPSGALDYDELTVTYRNHSLLLPSNGGRLVSSPASSIGADKLTDGWRNGTGKTWHVPSPKGPQELIYSFVRPVTINAVQIHQDLEHPSREVEVYTSNDGLTWKRIFNGLMASVSLDGPNYAQLFKQGLSEPARHVKVRVLSGYQLEAWGLGEVELFGGGALMGTDDDWYTVNADITGLDPSTTYHYRVVVTDGVNVTRGPDRTFDTPATTKPILATGAATRITDASAKLDARVTPMGLATDYWFEIGTSTAYGVATALLYAGAEITPRTIVGRFDTLSPATTYHYRVVAMNSAGTTFGEDRTFTTK